MTATPPPGDRERDALLMHAAIDGELDPANALALEQRIAADPALAGERARVEALRQALHDKLPLEDAPAALRARIREAVGLGAARPSSQFSRRVTWQALAASVACAAVLSSSGTWYAMRATPGDTVAEAVLAGHLRGLMAPEPTDVASSDRHTVKPWFNGRIPQAPRVVDLAAQGFPLIGGRIDVVDRTGVPTLVYRDRQHLISLTAVAGAGRDQPVTTAPPVKGFNVIRWAADGIAYWAVSDLEAGELATFARLFRDAPAEQ